MNAAAILEATEPQPETHEKPLYAYDSDGYPYALADGEVLDPADLERYQLAPGLDDQPKPFVINDRPSAEWALERREIVCSLISAIEERRAFLNANLNRQRKQLEAKLKWWDWRFRDQFIAFARTMIKGKSKTVVFDHGTFSLRTSKGKSSLTDEDAALAFVEVYNPDGVKRSATMTTLRETAEQVIRDAKSILARENLSPKDQTSAEYDLKRATDALALIKTVDAGEKVVIETGDK